MLRRIGQDTVLSSELPETAYRRALCVRDVASIALRDSFRLYKISLVICKVSNM